LTRQNGILKRWLVPVMVAGMVAPVWVLSGRRGWADWQYVQARTPEALRAACGLDPGRADCRAAVARAREEQAADAGREWERVLELNPRSASYLAQAALAAEFRGDTGGAERLLLQAARYNRLWLPRWSLASFYFRHGRMEEFRRWAALAFERAYGDRTALFRLCRAAGVEDGTMLEEMLGADAENLGAWVGYLAAEGPVEALPAAAARYVDVVPAGTADAVLRVNGAIRALLRAGHGEKAAALWSAMSRRGLIRYEEWSEAAPLVNSEFGPPVPGAGLDWEVARGVGFEVFPGVPPGGIKVTFSGRQPERVELLAQEVLLRGGQAWQLEFEHHTPGIEAGATSLGWRLGGLEAVEGEGRLSSEEWTRGAVVWEVPAGLKVLRLGLWSERPRGQARHEGELRLRGMSLRPVEGGR
jgi:pentatricopeptide repeat protein